MVKRHGRRITFEEMDVRPPMGHFGSVLLALRRLLGMDSLHCPLMTSACLGILHRISISLSGACFIIFNICVREGSQLKSE